MAYGAKCARKAAGSDCAVALFEALWWADDMATFAENARAAHGRGRAGGD